MLFWRFADSQLKWQIHSNKTTREKPLNGKRDPIVMWYNTVLMTAGILPFLQCIHSQQFTPWPCILITCDSKSFHFARIQRIDSNVPTEYVYIYMHPDSLVINKVVKYRTNLKKHMAHHSACGGIKQLNRIKTWSTLNSACRCSLCNRINQPTPRMVCSTILDKLLQFKKCT